MVFLVFLRCHVVWGVAGQPREQRVQAGTCGGWAWCHLGGPGDQQREAEPQPWPGQGLGGVRESI